MLEASVIICTHNPHRLYLERALTALRAQTLSVDRWELIVVDNGSSQKVADFCDISWHARGRHVQEQQLGLAFARLRGIAEATGQLLVFVDDDNVLADDYLEHALCIDDEYRFLGAWGSGAISLEFEAEPADHLIDFLPWLGLRHADRPTWSNAISCDEATPIGAGLCVRRQIADAYAEFFRKSSIQITGRKGTSLGGHEDFEICYLACNAGLGMAVFPELKILHLITAKRVTDDHIVKLVESVTTTKLMLSHKWVGDLPRSPFSTRGMILLIVNLLKRGRFERRVYFAELRAVMAARRLLIT
jgi:glycosyltransferase involved in cell wall biosynthesis